MFFFFNDTATTEIYTLSLHDALPISVGALRGRPRRLRLAEQLYELPLRQLDQRGVGAAVPKRCITREAAAPLGARPLLEQEPELVARVGRHAPGRVHLPSLVVDYDRAARHLRLRRRRERDLSPQLPGVGGVGAEALEAPLELDLLGQARGLRAVGHLRRALGELGEELRVLGIAEQPDALAARLGELAQLAQRRQVVGLVRRGHPHPGGVSTLGMARSL